MAFVNFKNCVKFDSDYVKSVLEGCKSSQKDKQWEEQEIRHLLLNNDKMVVSSLLKLYSYQTNEEQNSGKTINDNGVGFNSYDAKFLTGIAIQCIKDLFITNKQISLVRKSITKYAKQLTKIANQK